MYGCSYNCFIFSIKDRIKIYDGDNDLVVRMAMEAKNRLKTTKRLPPTNIADCDEMYFKVEVSISSDFCVITNFIKHLSSCITTLIV